MYEQKLSLRDKLAKNFINAVGWSSKRKMVLIESDDWGSIRTASRKAYETLLAANGGTGDFFDKYDALESSEDLEMLFDVLSSVKDKNGNPFVMSPISVVANPDFEAIEKNGFSEYVYETVLDTYKRSSTTENSFNVAQEGIRTGVWNPQFHGREHVNVKRWMRALKVKDDISRLAFLHRSLNEGCMPSGINYFRAFDIDSTDDLAEIKKVMEEGLALFEKVWGYKAMAFCAPCGFIRRETVDVAAMNGVLMAPGQFFSSLGDGTVEKVNKTWGSKARSGITFYRRNCKFEPSRDHNIDWVDRCMSEIKIAFRWGKPAVIDSHRVNFIGSIYPENRDYTLRELKRLLQEIVKRWPDVEFVNSGQIYNAING